MKAPQNEMVVTPALTQSQQKQLKNIPATPVVAQDSQAIQQVPVQPNPQPKQAKKKLNHDLLTDVQKMKLELERDRCDRLDIPFDASKVMITNKIDASQIKKALCALNTLNNLVQNSPISPVQVCLKTIILYVKNVIKNPAEPKYLNINVANETFQKRVRRVRGGIMVLKAFGFVEEEQKLVLKKYDAELFKKGTELLEAELFNSYGKLEAEMEEAKKVLKQQISHASFEYDAEPEV